MFWSKIVTVCYVGDLVKKYEDDEENEDGEKKEKKKKEEKPVLDEDEMKEWKRSGWSEPPIREENPKQGAEAAALQ